MALNRIVEQSFEVLPSAARTASPAAEDYFGAGQLQDANGKRNDEDSSYRGLVLAVDVSATAATTSTLKVSLQGVDEVSGSTWSIADSGSLSAVGTTAVRVHPSLVSASGFVGDLVPPRFRVVAEHTGTESFTYSVSVHMTY